MNLFIVWLKNEEETLFFVAARDEDQVKWLMNSRCITNFHIRGVIASWDLSDPYSVNLFKVDKHRLEELATTFDN